MEWVKLDLSTIRSTEFLGCEPAQRAAYITILGYCADQENSGIIKDCAGWGDRKWMSLCGVMKSEVVDCGLFYFDGNDLVVWKYPQREQDICESKRAHGKASAKKRWDEERRLAGEKALLDGSPNGSPINNDGSPIAEPNKSPNAEDTIEEDTIEEDTIPSSSQDNEDLFSEESNLKSTQDKNNELNHSQEVNNFYDWKFTDEYTTLKRLSCRPTEKTWLEWQALIDAFSLKEVQRVAASIPASKRFNPIAFHDVLESTSVGVPCDYLGQFAPFIKYAASEKESALSQLKYIVGKTSLERTLKKAESLALANGGQLWVNEFTAKFMETQQCM